jgi:hypothetical protein
MIWMLYVILTNGEAGPVPASQHVCQLMAAAVRAGERVEADTDFGRVTIRAASCLGPVAVEPCEVEATS